MSRRPTAHSPATTLRLERLPDRIPPNFSLLGDWLLAGLFSPPADLASPEPSKQPVAVSAVAQAVSDDDRLAWESHAVEARADSSESDSGSPHGFSTMADDVPWADEGRALALVGAAALDQRAQGIPEPAQAVPTDPVDNSPYSERHDRSAAASRLDVAAAARRGSALNGGAIPAQYVAKHYSEALGRLPDQGGWESALGYFYDNGCHAQSLKTYGRSVYLSPEFDSFPYDNASKLLAVYRGALNREPDAEGFASSLKLLDQGASWADVVDTLYDREEFHGLVPYVCSGYSYSFGDAVALDLPPSGDGFQGGSGRDLQVLLDRAAPGQTVWLAQKAVVRLDVPLVLPPRVTLATRGTPPHNHYARMGRLVRDNLFSEAAVKLRDGARLQSVWVDGARGRLGFNSDSINVQLFGGNGTAVTDSVISNTAGWSSLQALGRFENNPCASNTLSRNLVTVYSSDHFNGTWADGLSVACENARVEDNEIVDATDVPIVLFRATPAVQRSVVRNNRLLSAGNSAYGGLVADPLRSGQLHDFTGASVDNNVLWTGPNTYFVIGISVGTRAWFGAQSDMGTGIRFTDNTTGSQYALVNTGIGVSGMWDATVQRNTLQAFPLPVARCPVVDVGASVSAGYASGDLQAYTDVLIQGCIGY